MYYDRCITIDARINYAGKNSNCVLCVGAESASSKLHSSVRTVTEVVLRIRDS